MTTNYISGIIRSHTSSVILISPTGFTLDPAKAKLFTDPGEATLLAMSLCQGKDAVPMVIEMLSRGVDHGEHGQRPKETKQWSLGERLLRRLLKRK